MMTRPVINMETVGKNLKHYRKANHLSVEEVREYMMLESHQAIYKWEAGQCFPQCDNFLALALLYGASIEDIVYGK